MFLIFNDLELSIQSAERDKRSTLTSSIKVIQVIDGRKIPDWKKFITVDSNKQVLLKILPMLGRQLS
jgi:hypothetical protein